MQQERKYPTKRFCLIFLASLFPMLSGCGGGGRSTASTPPSLDISSLNFEGGQARTQTDQLFQSIEGTGPRWITLIDSDNGYTPLRGVKALTNDVVAKLPNPTPIKGITTRYSRVSYLKNTIASQQNPGRYMIWGRQSDQPLPNSAFQYQLGGAWTCVACTNDGQLRHGAIAGLMTIDPLQSQADLNLNGDGLSLTATLTLNNDQSLSTRELPSSLVLDGKALSPIRADMIGSIFGDQHEEAGLVFGIADNEGRVISGGVAGSR